MEKSRMQKDQLRRSKASWETTIRKAQLQFRGCTIFSAMSVLPYDEDASSEQRVAPILPPPELHHVERLLPNGDFFTGLASWSPSSSSSSSSSSCSSSSDMMPHGAGGKYLWTDGCMYEGDWVHGRATGKGKFSWPSGATYEGDFKSWFLDGAGIFTGASGDTYRGRYSMNLKHGRGRRTYPNGDYYDGEWRRGHLEGSGRYVWKAGHEYNGWWKGGNMSGKGVLFWANGNSFDGEWDEGVPCGKGQFRWRDGGVFVGIWTKDRGSHRNGGTVLISASPENVRREPEEELQFGLADCKVCPGENLLIYPSEKVIHWTAGNNAAAENDRKPLYSKLSCVTDPSASPRFKKGSTDSVQIATSRRPTNGCPERPSSTWGSDGDHLIPSPPPPFKPATSSPREPTTPVKLPPTGELKKQGQTISKGHKNYELMLTLQLGIRHSVGKTTPIMSLDLKPSAFNPKEKFWTRFPPEGSKHTPPHQSCEFRWKDYCPAIFRTLRQLFKVDPADYMLSICGNDALREFSSPGKSGSFFYLSHDDRYMIKTVKKADIKVLRKMLPGYFKHVRAFENTLLTKFYGLHCVKLAGATQKKVRFVIMGNLFCTNYPIHRRFDLKGSSHGRVTDKPESEIDETTTLKDLDLNFIFRLEKSLYRAFVRQIERDCQFLENEKIMDYSLLVGLHFREMASWTDDTEVYTDPTAGSSNGSPGIGTGAAAELQKDLNGRFQPFKLGISMPCLVEQVVRRSDSEQQPGEPTDDLYEAILFFGIIDILQDYDISKKLEHAYKSMHYDSTTISSVDPRQYAKRFRDFIFHIFQEAS